MINPWLPANKTVTGITWLLMLVQQWCVLQFNLLPNHGDEKHYKVHKKYTQLSLKNKIQYLDLSKDQCNAMHFYIKPRPFKETLQIALPRSIIHFYISSRI